jgi:hypothetical protein
MIKTKGRMGCRGLLCPEMVARMMKDHLRADERVLADNVFPGSAGVKPMAGLV